MSKTINDLVVYLQDLPGVGTKLVGPIQSFKHSQEVLSLLTCKFELIIPKREHN